MKSIIIASVLLLGGCASNCQTACVAGFGPGNSVFDKIANHYDTRDPCQLVGKPENYQFPNFCFYNSGKRIMQVRNVNGQLVYTVK